MFWLGFEGVSVGYGAMCCIKYQAWEFSGFLLISIECIENPEIGKIMLSFHILNKGIVKILSW